MAYGKVNIRIRQISTLRGDQKTKGGKATDGGYARKDFFVETHLEGEKVSQEGLKKMIIGVVKPTILRNFAGYKNKYKK